MCVDERTLQEQTIETLVIFVSENMLHWLIVSPSSYPNYWHQKLLICTTSTSCSNFDRYKYQHSWMACFARDFVRIDVRQYITLYTRSKLTVVYLHIEINGDEFVHEIMILVCVHQHTSIVIIRVLLKYCVILWFNVIIVVFIAVYWF